MLATLAAMCANANTTATGTKGQNQDPANVNTQPRVGAATVGNSSESDTEVTRKIRQEIMNKDLSVAAKNVTISTNAGKVLLTGNVANPQEKSTVYETAATIAGRSNVRNELTIKK